MIYNEEAETLPREALKALQLKRLQQVVHRVYHTVGFTAGLSTRRVLTPTTSSLLMTSRNSPSRPERT